MWVGFLFVFDKEAALAVTIEIVGEVGSGNG